MTILETFYPRPEHEQKESFWVAEPVCANQLLGERLAEPSGLSIGDANIHFYVVDRKQATDIVGIIDASMNAKQFNELLLVDAPNKTFGLDTQDIINDWGRMDQNDAATIALRKRHERMGKAWEVFMEPVNRPFLLRFFKDSFRNYAWNISDTSPKITPVIRYTLDKKGNRQPQYEQLSASRDKDLFFQNIINAHVSVTKGKQDHRWLHTLAGFYTLAYISPETRESWKQRDSYNSVGTGETQVMGTTQVVVQALRNPNLLLQTKFLDLAEKHIIDNSRTFEIPKL